MLLYRKSWFGRGSAVSSAAALPCTTAIAACVAACTKSLVSRYSAWAFTSRCSYVSSGSSRSAWYSSFQSRD